MILECCKKRINISTCTDINESKLFFWAERFCPSVKTSASNGSCDFVIYCIKSINSRIYRKFNCYFLEGDWNNSEDFLAKFVTQLFQSLLINQGIVIIPSACVTYKKNNCILFLGDFWQGKTTSAKSYAEKKSKKLISDNYVLYNKGFVQAGAKYISILENRINEVHDTILLKDNNRLFFKNSLSEKKCKLSVTAIFVPYINSEAKVCNQIPRKEAVWYLYQKFSRLLCGETILFAGKVPSPCFLDEENSQIILNIVNSILDTTKIYYISSSIYELPDLVEAVL